MSTGSGVMLPTAAAGFNAAANAWALQLITKMRALETKAADGGTLSDEDTAEITSALAELQDALNLLDTTIAELEQTEALEAADIVLKDAVSDMLGKGAAILAKANESAGKLANGGTEMILRAFVEGLKNKYAIVNEAIVRNNLSLVVEAVNASMGLTAATVEEIKQAYANGDVAEAQSLNTVGTAIAGNRAAIVQIMGSSGGTASHWAVQTNAQDQVTGIVRLDGNASGSTFTVVANVFQVAQPSATGGDPTTIFVIGNRNGTPALGVRADMFLDGSIVARHLAVSSLDAITANLGVVTAGVIQSANGKVKLDLNAGTFEIFA